MRIELMRQDKEFPQPGAMPLHINCPHRNSDGSFSMIFSIDECNENQV